MRHDRPHLAIFDCDGTLVDSERIVKSVLADGLTRLGLPTSCDTLLARFRGGKMSDFLAYAEERLGRPLPEQFEPLLRSRIAKKLAASLQPMAGAEQLLGAMDIPVCVASNGPRHYIASCLKTSNLLHFFKDNIFSAYDIGAWKPDPALFLSAANDMGVDPKHCIVVEDSIAGLTAAHAAGMRAFLLGQENENRGGHQAILIPKLPSLLEYL